MPRPRNEHPTPAELEVLKIIWGRGPSTVRDVLEALKSRRKRRAYTSVMSLMNVMTAKGLLVHKSEGRAFLYDAKTERETTLNRMVGDLCKRAFEDSASALVTHLLEQAKPTAEELAEIRRLIERYEQHQGDE